MMRTTKLTLAVTIFAGLLPLGPTKAYAQTLPGIEFGANQRTRDWADNYLKAVADQIRSLAREFIPIIDTDIKGYLDKLNMIVSDNVDKAIKSAQCGGNGELLHLQQTVEGTIAKYIVSDTDNYITPDDMPHPIQSLDKNISKTEEQFRYTTAPLTIADGYDDLMVYTTSVQCWTRMTEKLPIAEKVLDTMRSLYGPALDWGRTIGPDRNHPNCKTVGDCLIFSRRSLKAVIDDPDNQQDVAHVGAVALYERLPPDPVPPASGLQLIGADRIAISDYNLVLEREREVEFLVAGARMARQLQANDLYTGAVKQRDEAIKALPNIESELSSQSSGGQDEINDTPKLETMVVAIGNAQADADRAAQIDPRLKTVVDGFRKENQKQFGDACSVQKKAVDFLKMRVKLARMMRGGSAEPDVVQVRCLKPL